MFKVDSYEPQATKRLHISLAVATSGPSEDPSLVEAIMRIAPTDWRNALSPQRKRRGIIRRTRQCRPLQGWQGALPFNTLASLSIHHGNSQMLAPVTV